MGTEKYELYISEQGNDKWSGQLPQPDKEHTDGPVATVERARDLIREANEQGRLSGPASVWLRGGRYHIDKPIIFGPQDAAHATYEAYPGEQPIIDGGRKIGGWGIETVNDRVCWVTKIPEAAQGQWYFRQLFVNGERRSRSRLPKEGYFWMEDVPEIDLDASLFEGSDTFKAHEGDIRHWKNLDDVDVVVIHYWTEERMPVQSFDEGTGIVTSSRRSIFSLKDDVARRYAKYYAENILEAMTEPGEWYLDRKTGRLHYIPMPGEELDSLEVFASQATQFIKLEGSPEKNSFVQFIGFKGLCFEHGEWIQPKGGGEPINKPGIDFAAATQAANNIPGVISMKGARHCTVEDCRIRHAGWYGIEMSDGCMGNRIVGNEICDMGAGGIKLGGADFNGDRSLWTGKNVVTDNHVHMCGRIFHSACGILSMHSFGNEFSHNHIHDLYYTGISCGWNWGYADNISRENRIEDNHVHDLGHGLLSDMGGIYTLGIQPGTVIRGNLIHDIEKRNYGGWAIYPDEGSSHILIENNICHHTSSQGFYQHYGRENIVRNNIFAFGNEGQIAYGKPENHRSFTFERNIAITDGKPILAGSFGGRLEKMNFFSDLNLYWDVSGHDVVSGNLTYDDEANCMLTRSFSMEEMRELGYDLHSTTANPGFKDLDRLDFTLSEDSPALALGFKPIDMSGAGPRPANRRG